MAMKWGEYLAMGLWLMHWWKSVDCVFVTSCSNCHQPSAKNPCIGMFASVPS